MSRMEAPEAETQRFGLLDRAERGEEITMTKEGRPVTGLDAADGIDRQQVKRTIEEIKEFSGSYSLGGLSIRDLIEDGRR